MAIQLAAIMAVIAAVQQLARVPMITRLLEHSSHATTWTHWDDVLVDALCDVPETALPAAVDAMQARYDGLTPDELAAHKEHSPTLLLAGTVDNSATA